VASYTTTNFLSSVRQRGSIPTTTNTNNVNSTTNLLSMATEEMHLTLLPMILAAREEYYVATKDHTITADQSAYAIPTRGIGQVLRDVQIVEGTAVRSLPRIEVEDITTTATGTPQAYYLKHDKVVLYPTPGSTTGTLRLNYFLRPGRLAAVADCAQISAIDTGTNTITVSSIPSSWVTGNDVDLIAGDSPYQYRAIDQDTTITGSTIVLSSLPSDLAVGDWVALADYSPIPQVPYEFQPLLAQITVVKALESIGDTEGLKTAKKALEELQRAALTLISPRNQGEPKKVNSRRWWK
jgi:hypothetical protein